MRRNEQMVKIVHPETGEEKTLPARNAHDHIQHLGWVGADPTDETPEQREHNLLAHAPRKIKTIDEQVRALKAKRAGRLSVPSLVNPGPLVLPDEPNVDELYARMDATQNLDPLEVDANLPEPESEPSCDEGETE